MDGTQDTIQRVIGWICVLGLFGLAFLSMEADLTLTWPVILGLLIAIAMLLGKLEALSKVLENWKK